MMTTFSYLPSRHVNFSSILALPLPRAADNALSEEFPPMKSRIMEYTTC